MSRRIPVEVAFAALAVIGAISLARLTTGHAAPVAFVIAALVGEVVTAVVLPRISWAPLLGTVAVALVALGAAEPRLTWHRLPTPSALEALGRALRDVGSLHVPVAPGAGVLAVGALLAGVAAVVSRVAPGVGALAPALALVTASTVALPSSGAALLALALVAAGALALLAGATDLAGPVVTAGAVAIGAVCIVLLGTAASADFPGIGTVSPGGAPAPGVAPTALSLVSNLTGVQARDPDLVMFTAATPEATYWQVASLTVLDADGVWVPDAATQAALSGRPSAATNEVPAGQTFVAAVSISHLSSRLLPVPPETVAVAGATVTAGGAVIAGLTDPGMRYTAQALVPPSEPPDPAMAPGPPEDTQLPSLPPVVAQLARSVTASATTPLQKAEALTSWFRSSAFHYSLSAPASSLVSFLTITRTGSCQQFAGAFAAMARSIGLPTRVAVGFTAGHRELSGITVVQGVDAHAWPQVLLNGRWTSFEPTPQKPSGELSPPGVLGPTGRGRPNPVGPPRVPHGVRLPHLPRPTPTPTSIPPSGHVGSRASGGHLPWLWGSLAAVLMVAAALAALVWRRRSRRPGPLAQLRAAWERIERALHRRGLGRMAWQTPLTYVSSLHLTAANDQLEAALHDIAKVSALLERVAYGGTTVTAAEAAEADLASRRAARVVRHADTDELARRADHPPSDPSATGQRSSTGRNTSPV